MGLPIELVKQGFESLLTGTSAPCFKWRQVVDTPVGKHTVEHTGSLSPTLESAVIELISIAERQDSEIKKLKSSIRSLEEVDAALKAAQTIEPDAPRIVKSNPSPTPPAKRSK